jgi:hypothetical protein
MKKKPTPIKDPAGEQEPNRWGQVNDPKEIASAAREYSCGLKPDFSSSDLNEPGSPFWWRPCPKCKKPGFPKSTSRGAFGFSAGYQCDSCGNTYVFEGRFTNGGPMFYRDRSGNYWY